MYWSIDQGSHFYVLGYRFRGSFSFTLQDHCPNVTSVIQSDPENPRKYYHLSISFQPIKLINYVCNLRLKISLQSEDSVRGIYSRNPSLRGINMRATAPATS